MTLSGNKSFILLLVLVLASFAQAEGPSFGSLSELQGVKTLRSRLPVFDGTQLKYHIFSGELAREGIYLVSTGTIIDLMRPKVHVDEVAFDETQLPYPLNATLLQILDFWRKRSFAECAIFTKRAKIDYNARVAAGEDPVFVRSPMLDLDGVGFEADFNRRTVRVLSDVRIAIRQGNLDPRSILKGNPPPASYEPAHAVADTLSIDQEKREITLSGSVKVDFETALVHCDELVIRLENDETKQDEKIAVPENSVAELGGVRELSCTGNVRIERKLTPEERKNGAQTAEADRVDYLVARQLITLHGGEKQAVIQRGNDRMRANRIEIYRETEQILLYERSRIEFTSPQSKESKTPAGPMSINSDTADLNLARNRGTFRGNIVLDSPEMKLRCGRMNVLFSEVKKTLAAAPKSGMDPMSGITDIDFSGASSRELREVVCLENVDVLRRVPGDPTAPEQRARAGRLTLDYPKRQILLTENVPTLFRGNDSISGRELTVWLEEERLQAERGSRIILCAATTGNESVSGTEAVTEITSDSSNLSYGKNKLLFSGNVKVRDPRLSLDCDKLEIFLKDRPTAVASRPAEKTPAEPDSANKQLSHIVATGRVVARDAQAELRTARLELTFAPPLAGTKPSTEGLFQSSDVELVQMDCTGGMKLRSLADTAPGKPAAAPKEGASPLRSLIGAGARGPMNMEANYGKVDLRKNLSECHEKVKITDSEMTLTCEDLYFHTRDLTPQEKLAAVATAAAGAATAVRPSSLDDDPFAARGNDIPTRLLLGESKELVQSVAENNVHVVRRLPAGKVQAAKGDKAVYAVADRQLVLTGKPARLNEDNRNLNGDRIVFFPETEDVLVSGNSYFSTKGQ